jgi:anti-sigma B factor antagonist
MRAGQWQRLLVCLINALTCLRARPKMARKGKEVERMQLTINPREHQDVTVLDLSGRLVVGEECDTLRNQIKDLLASNHTKILLNMGEVARVDSTGIGILVEAVINTTKQDGQLKLANLPRLIRNILATHRLLQAFEVYDNEEQALASFEKAA